MKQINSSQVKDRVIALDYFRGVCILVILLSHSSTFGGVFADLSGMGRLWTSAAEMFFLISGITLATVRGKYVLSNFKLVLSKSLRRARDIYIIYILSVISTLAIAALLSSSLVINALNISPTSTGLGLLAQILSFKFSVGLANFLMYYAVYMLFAPFILYSLWKRYWPLVPLLSALLYLLASPYPVHILPASNLTSFATWQLYFALGLTLGRFRVEIISWFYGLSQGAKKALRASIISVAGAALALSAAIGFNWFTVINKLIQHGWLPQGLGAAYLRLRSLKPQLDLLLMNNRAGALRPLAALLFLSAAYLLYQKYKEPLLSRTGKVVNTMGKDTLWIFSAQALLVPAMMALPIRHYNLAINLVMVAFLLGSMWALTQRKRLLSLATNYFKQSQSIFGPMTKWLQPAEPEE